MVETKCPTVVQEIQFEGVNLERFLLRQKQFFLANPFAVFRQIILK